MPALYGTDAPQNIHSANLEEGEEVYAKVTSARTKRADQTTPSPPARFPFVGESPRIERSRLRKRPWDAMEDVTDIVKELDDA